jgi:hypothetical protein
MPYRILFSSLIFSLIASVQSADTLPSYDFTQLKTPADWTAAHDLAAPELSADGLILNITGADPQLCGPEMQLSGDELWLRIRLRSDTGGLGQIFFDADHASAENSIFFEVPAGIVSEQLLALPRLGEKCRLRLDPPGDKGRCVISLIRVEQPQFIGVTHIDASADTLKLTVKSADSPLDIIERNAHESLDTLASAPSLAKVEAHSEKVISLPRFDAERDRLYSGFIARDSRGPVGALHIADTMAGISKNTAPYPDAKSKKGLQVQMVDDAIALGVKHAALNVNMAALIDPAAAADSYTWKMDGEIFYFKRRQVDAIPVKPLSDAGVLVNLILLNYVNADPAVIKIMRPPRAKAEAPNHITGFNLDTPEGVRWFKACCEFLADRFSAPDSPHGRAVGYIVGNEVNSHWYWYNLDRTALPNLIDEYMRALRIVHTAVRKSSSSARVYISLDHFWTGAIEKDPLRSMGSRLFVDYLTRLSRLGGDFDWHIAYHPYPENLNEPRVWNDKTALPDFESPRITFKNLEQLPAYMRREKMLCNGLARRIILSEQGFHTPIQPGPVEGQLRQAAGFCYAYYKVAHLDGIDAFIYHRHVDYDGEGAHFGLWTFQPGTICTPKDKKQIYEIFKNADTLEWEKTFEFALPVIGIKNWEEIMKAPINANERR